jgi:hypothetical protein
MSDPLADFCRARLPAAALASLGPLRATPELRALIRGDELWLLWPPGEPELARTILALNGAELFGLREGNWHRPGASLPSFNVPDEDDARPLSSLLTPAPFEPIPPGAGGWVSLSLRLVGCDVPRPSTLMRLSLAELAGWADRAATHELAALTATHDQGVVLLRGAKLPPLSGERFWGRRVLFPLGRRPEPDLGEDVLATALRLDAGELALVSAERAELVPLAAFAPLTRAGVRLACRTNA